MNVFLCWSGQASLAIATALHEWLPDCIQGLEPFMSSESIRKGDRWRSEIGNKLAETNFGILCLTPTNLSSAWIHFEAGAISKHVTEGRVTSLLYKIKAGDVTGPLSQFQNTQLSKEDVRKLLKDINSLMPERGLDDARLERAFETNWPRLESKLNAISSEKPESPTPPARDVPDMVAELLNLVRSQSRQIQQLAEMSKTHIVLGAPNPGDGPRSRQFVTIGDTIVGSGDMLRDTPLTLRIPAGTKDLSFEDLVKSVAVTLKEPEPHSAKATAEKGKK